MRYDYHGRGMAPNGEHSTEPEGVCCNIFCSSAKMREKKRSLIKGGRGAAAMRLFFLLVIKNVNLFKAGSGVA